MTAKKTFLSFVLSFMLILLTLFLCSACGDESQPEPNEISITVADKIYDGNPISVRASYTNKLIPELFYRNSSDEDVEASYTQIAPKDAGSYVVLAKVRSNQKQDFIEKQASFNIFQKELCVAWSSMTIEERTYNASVKIPNVTASGLIEGDSCDLSAVVTEGKDNINVGTFTMTVVSASNPNYKLPPEGVTRNSPPYEIIKATPNVEAPTGLYASLGQTLADVVLPTGFSWKDDPSTSVGELGINRFDAIFTPVDVKNWNRVETSVQLTVSQNNTSLEVLNEQFFAVNNTQSTNSFVSNTQGVVFESDFNTLDDNMLKNDASSFDVVYVFRLKIYETVCDLIPLKNFIEN